MRTEITLDGAGPQIAALLGATGKIRRGWQRGAYGVGARATTLAKAMARQVTAVRSGARVRSYDSAISDDSNGVTLTFGAIRPGRDGQVPLHVRVHEGYNFQGVQVARFVIRAKNAKFLTFPVRAGGGFARGGIVGWASKREVILTPTPVVEPIGRQIPGALEITCGKVFVDALHVVR